MDIESVNNQLSQMIEKAGNDVESTMNSGDMNDPTRMLQAQFAIQKYSTFVSYHSAVMKAVKDMLAGIIQKI
ncbi:type III secretion system needle filament subunit SctF [Pseudomonas sp. TH31]|uniref:type III secretion system needle filament subunit SctF n=1 Tax=Pseudomonas sp. TH31 TaxID=2796396 RepID=UPI001913939B|nr:type III secretion system needle filament subunit SctF [Pseudomonas sp. TH31]MBK5415408.1 type III secretion system needle protein SsaG [Pseudomonas sp. TH31]